MPSIPAHIARPTKRQKIAKSFPIGTEMNNRRLLELAEKGATKSENKYRVLNLVCGHESIITHKRFIETRFQHGQCQSCARIRAVEKQKDIWDSKRAALEEGDEYVPGRTYLDRWRAKKAAELKDCLWFHKLMNESLQCHG